jgi:hypothetical protein
VEIFLEPELHFQQRESYVIVWRDDQRVARDVRPRRVGVLVIDTGYALDTGPSVPPSGAAPSARRGRDRAV